MLFDYTQGELLNGVWNLKNVSTSEGINETLLLISAFIQVHLLK